MARIADASQAMAKSELTRERIFGSAMDLFRSKGFDETTMRDIAAKAGMATGAAYYYFDSKDAIVMAFYNQAQVEMEPLLEETLGKTTGLKERLRGVLEVKLKYFTPNRQLLRALAAHVDPGHPLSPFSIATRAIRERDMKIFERALADCRIKIASDLQPQLPRLLWMYQMGIILFWLYDRSSGQERTRRVIQQSVTIVVGLIKLAGLPLTRPLRRPVTDLVETVTH